MDQNFIKAEKSRINRSLGLLCSRQKKSFDEITELAAMVCQTPISLISFFEDDSPIFEFRFGWNNSDTAQRQTFSATAKEFDQGLLVVEDVRKDPRFQDNPIVGGDPGVVFLASIPLLYQGKHHLGALCVMDFKPRKLSEAQIRALEALTNQVHQLISFQLALEEKELAIALAKEQSPLTKQLVQSLPGLFLMFDQKGKISLWNSEFLKISGYSESEISERTFCCFFSSENCPNMEEVTRLAFELGELETEADLVSKGGERRSFLLKIIKIEYQENTYLMACGFDLSAVKKVNKELELSEYKFKSLVQDGGDLIAILDLNGIYSYVSPTSTHILGIRPEDFVGKKAFDFIHHEDLPQMLEGFKTLEKQKRVSISPFRFKNSEGEWRWVETILTNLTDDPAIRGIVANSRDVTEKINAHQEIAASEQRYKVILESQTNYFVRTDLNGNYTFVNKKFINEFGWIYCGEILGKNSLNSICEYHHMRVLETVNLCLDKPGKVYKVALDKPSQTPGEVVTTIWDFFCVQDSNGDPQEIQCSGIDVTDTVYYEKELQRSNERFEIIAKATNDILWDFDIQKNQLYVSEGFNSQFGYDDELKFSSLKDFLDLIHPADRDSVGNQLREFLDYDGVDKKWGIDYRMRKGDGNYSFIQHKSFFIRDRKGKAIRALGALVDITPRKEYEKSLMALNLELEKRVKELAVSNLELEQFAYVTSHDLQEPLRMISSFLTLLEMKYGPKLDDKANQYIGFAVDGAKRMRQLILDLLDYSQSGKISTEKQLVDLNEVARQVFLFYKKVIEEKGGMLRYGNLPRLFISNVSLNQVLQNLVENAVKYSKPGIPPIISIEAEEKKSEWLISVNDNGIGIEPEYFEKVFIIFQRLHTKDKYEGTGIGLSIVKKQVESWGGRIWLESNLETGTTFFFTVPK
ncbi:MAG TPA: PAS domain S-box protein [Algoriphagus sp.]|nr:PAS domain S-box protein [Algoriphagus sp.]